MSILIKRRNDDEAVCVYTISEDDIEKELLFAEHSSEILFRELGEPERIIDANISLRMLFELLIDALGGALHCGYVAVDQVIVHNIPPFCVFFIVAQGRRGSQEENERRFAVDLEEVIMCLEQMVADANFIDTFLTVQWLVKKDQLPTDYIENWQGKFREALKSAIRILKDPE